MRGLTEVQQGGNTLATYAYNAQGQRTRKVTPSGTTVYHYDLAGNLVSETTDTGAPIRDYVWQDATPVAQIDIQAGAETLIFLHTDHLQTPRLATNTSGNAIWRWEGEAFGNTLPNQDVDGDGQITTINGRFPGQYADAETGFYYNWNRYYDALAGRYVTSDPIGLEGGLNTYTYVGSNPARYEDPHGLDVWDGGGIATAPGIRSTCAYYSDVCRKLGGKCVYACWIAPGVCRAPFVIFVKTGVIPKPQVDCIRNCLIEEDKKAREKQTCTGPDCLSVETVDNYHRSCYARCGVDPGRYPGIPRWVTN